MSCHAVETVRVHCRGVVLQVVERDVDTFRRENLWRRWQIRQALINSVKRFRITGVISPIDRVFIGMKNAGVITRGPIRFILNADPRWVYSAGPIGKNRIVPVLGEVGVREYAVCHSKSPTVADLPVAFEKSRRRPGANQNWDR